MSATSAQAAPPETIEIRAILRSAAPRLVRDGFGPLAIFFAGWKLIGLGAGIALAAAFGLAIFVHERRRGQPAMIVRLALLLVAIRAIVGVSSGSATTYLAQEIGIDLLLGSLVLLSLTSDRPFTARFAGDVFPMPDEVAESPEFKAASRTITRVWAAYFFARAAVRLAALLTLSTDAYALVIALTDAPFLVALLAWSVYYTIAALRRSPRADLFIAAAQAREAGG